MRAQFHRGRAFTLIELLVVVAVIGLLLAILLPALERAREQGRIAVCLANLKAIGLSQCQYVVEDRSQNLPWAVPFAYRVSDFPQYTGAGIATSFIWGGGMPDRTAQQSQAAGVGNLSSADVWRLPPRFRPMNRYVFPGVSFDSGDRDDTVGPNSARVLIPMTLPGVFRCPSDRSAAVPLLGGANPHQEEDTPFRCWEFWGSSYPMNWCWSLYYKEAQEPAPYNLPANALGLNNVPGIGAKMLQRVGGGWESRFVTFFEGQFSYAAENAFPPNVPNPQETPRYIGWHKQANQHAAAYKDGHADYRYRDTRFTEGPGWTIWPNRPWGGPLAGF